MFSCCSTDIKIDFGNSQYVVFADVKTIKWVVHLVSSPIR